MWCSLSRVDMLDAFLSLHGDAKPRQPLDESSQSQLVKRSRYFLGKLIKFTLEPGVRLESRESNN